MNELRDDQIVIPEIERVAHERVIHERDRYLTTLRMIARMKPEKGASVERAVELAVGALTQGPDTDNG